MTTKKSKLGNFVKTSALILGLSLLTNPVSAQKLNQEIRWKKVETNKGYVLNIKSSTPLNKLSAYESTPTNNYFTTQNSHSYQLPSDSIKGEVSKYLSEIDVCEDCCDKYTVPKDKILVSKKAAEEWRQQDKKNKQATQKKINDLEKKLSENKNDTTTNQTNNFYDNSITINQNNNHFTTIIKQKEKPLNTTKDNLSTEDIDKFRIFLNANKSINTNEYSFLVSPQFKTNKNLSLGPYALMNFGKHTESTYEEHEKIELINQLLDISARTKGFVNEDSKSRVSYGFGLLGSFTTDNKKIMVNARAGLAKEDFSKKINSEGYDAVIQGNQILESKPFCFNTEIKNKEYIPEIAASINFGLGKGWFLGAEAQKRFYGKSEKLFNKRKDTNFNITLTKIFRKSKK